MMSYVLVAMVPSAVSSLPSTAVMAPSAVLSLVSTFELEPDPEPELFSRAVILLSLAIT
jgi:hypothetical protein